jgi:hypothetical protein
MSRRRVVGLMHRAGVEASPLSHLVQTGAYLSAIRGLSDRQLLAEYRRVLTQQARAMSDEELMAALRQAEADAAHQHTEG